MRKKRAPKKKARAKPPAKKKSHGGTRAGAGRKRDRLPKKLLDAIGEVPKTAAAFEDWRMTALATLFTAQAAGDVGSELAASLRATLGEMRRNAPAGPAPGDEDEDDDDDDDGPELKEVGSDGSLRLDP